MPVKPEPTEEQAQRAPNGQGGEVELEGTHPQWLLFQKYSRTLHGFVRRMVGNRDDADELFQELALAVLQHPKGPEQIEQFMAWCRGLAKHLLSHYYRTKRKRADLMCSVPGEDIFDDSSTDPERHVAANEILDRVFDGIDSRSRQMMVCRHLYGDSAAEIAQWTSLSPAAVRMKLMRLRSAARRST